MVLKDFLLRFPHYKSMEANHLRPSLFEPYILDWQDLCGGPLDIVTHYIYVLASWFFPLHV